MFSVIFQGVGGGGGEGEGENSSNGQKLKKMQFCIAQLWTALSMQHNKG